MILLRSHLGSTLRALRVEQGRTLRDVAKCARVSLGYLSEVERGQKEPSSELLNAICLALEISIGEVLSRVATEIIALELPTLTVARDAA